MRRSIATLALGLALAGGATSAIAAKRSSPEDLRRFVAITHGLEQAPLKPDAREDRAWALSWLAKAPDVTVTICTSMLEGLLHSDYPHAGEILLQDTFSTAAFAIEHPASDENAQQVAGVEGALTAYRSILRDRPDARSPDLETLLQTQAQGGLPDFVRAALVRCAAENDR